MNNFYDALFAFCIVIVSANCYTLTEQDLPELKYLNKSVDPCEDFYEFTCGNFKNVHPRPEDTVILDHFTLLAKDIVDMTTKILKEPNRKDDPEALKKARAAYKACADLDYIDSMPNPELSVIAEVKGFPMVTGQRSKEKFSWYEIADLIAEYGVPMVFNNFVSYPSYTDANKTMIYFTEEKLTYPVMARFDSQQTPEQAIESSIEEIASTPNLREEAPFTTLLKNLTLKMKYATGNIYTSDQTVLENLDETMTFMRTLALPHNVPVDGELVPLIPETYTITVKELQEWTDLQFGNKTHLNWVKFLNIVMKKSGVNVTDDTQVLCSNGFNQILYATIKTVEEASSDLLKNFALLRLFVYQALDSDAQTREAFEIYYKSRGNQVYSRSEYCTRKVVDVSALASTSFAVAYEYQLRHFNVNKLQKATEMIHDLWDAFAEIVSEADWMSDDNKATALLKNSKMITLLGYPEVSEDKTELDKFYESLRICSWDNYGNVKRLRAFRMAYQLSQAKSRDRTVWDKSPFDNNAYYTHATNRIIFPAAMLNPVFFTGNYSVVDYGRIGSIIGHEITHGFDSTGQVFNEEGLRTPWYSNETAKAAHAKQQCFKDQYWQYYVPQSDSYVNGTSTLNENLADNGGIREAYKAMKKYLSRSIVNYNLDNYTTDQLFFIGFGTMWCSEASDYYYEALSQSGSYSPTKWRVNGPLSNLEEFSEAFNCPVGSKMNPVEKCRLW